MQDITIIVIITSMTLLFPIVYFFNKGFETTRGPRITFALNVIFGMIALGIVIGTRTIILDNEPEFAKNFLYIIPIIVALSIYCGPDVSVTTGAGYILYHFITQDPTNDLILYITTPILIASIILFSYTSKDKIETRYPWIKPFIIYIGFFLAYSLIFIIINWIAGVINPIEFLGDWTWYIKAVFEISLLGILVGTFFLVDNLYKHTIDLSTYSIYERESFYRRSLVYEVIHELISRDNIEHGAIIIFRHHGEDDEKKELFLNEIVNNLKKINEDTIFFKSSPQDWAAFIPIDEYISNISNELKGNWKEKRDDNDWLLKIEKSFKSAQRKVGKSNISFEVGASFYGVQSNIISDLIGKCDFMIMQQYLSKESHNAVMIYDHKMFSKTIKVNSKVEQVSDIINFKNIKVEFEPLRKNKETLLVPIVSYIDENMFETKFYDDIDKLYEKELTSTYKRMIALHIIEAYARNKKNHKLLLPYTTEHMIYDFESGLFINKIINRDVDVKSIILSFDSQHENIWHPKVVESLNKLKNEKFKISISNVSYDFDSEKLLQNIKPNYILFKLDDVTQEMLVKLK